ncbi:MAG: ATP-binding protein [Bdellovibrionota bacterium]
MNSEKKIKLHWLTGGGEMGALIASKDWSQTPLGPIENWPSSLQTTVSLCLASNFPINIIWGDSHIQIYNDGYKIICGNAHPRALGEPYTVTWASAWPAIGEPFEIALKGETSFLENQRMFLERNGYPEETFFTFSLSPIRDEHGKIAGLFHPVTETTNAMLSERRTRTLREIAEQTGEANSVREVCTLAMKALNEFRRDVPMSLLYMNDGTGNKYSLCGTTGISSDHKHAHAELNSEIENFWKIPKINDTHRPEFIHHLDLLPEKLNFGEEEESLKDALIVPLGSPGHQGFLGHIVLGLSPRLPLDEAYTTFLVMLGKTISSALLSAKVFEEEKKKAEALAEIDRAKTAFFSNVSHEFRTPLTLMLGPLEDLLAGNKGTLPDKVRAEAEVIHRNTLRLLKLVNALLDFSRIESNRMEAHYHPVELGKFTREIASSFDSAMVKAGLEFKMKVSELKEMVYVDQEMWEKIVLNLLSNAFKFTLKGEILLQLEETNDAVIFSVKDTGTGIPKKELSKIFNRFHRVQGSHGRSHEGTGIGLALVSELVNLHGGNVNVESEPGKGSTFSVSIPKGFSHLPSEKIDHKIIPHSESHLRSQTYIEDALQNTESDTETYTDAYNKPTVLLADDNQDMREYIQRLLTDKYHVVACSDGKKALDEIRRKKPDLLLSDIMMPVMDGIELLQEIRNDHSLKTIPVILLSARAGEELKASGLDLGADDYLTKPFSARELLARVNVQIKMTKIRESSLAQEIRTKELQNLIRSRDEFLSIAGHELKTPITSLKMQLQMTGKSIDVEKNSAPAPEKLAQVVSKSLGQVDKLSKLVEDLLDVSRLNAGKMTYAMEEMDLSATTREVLERLSPQIASSKSSIELHITKPVLIKGDKFRIEQVITNLLTNCFKYGEGKPVLIDISSDKADAIVTVSDQGLGIAENKQSLIFNRFERAISSDNVSGLGLGLYITKMIVDAHGGNIQLKSELGHGSKFMVRLPLMEGRS